MQQDNDKFGLALDLVNNTNKNIFLTGKAGTGKTTFLRKLRDESFKEIVVVAPTGIAAVNAGGVTVNSFFQLPFGPYVPGITKLNNYNIKDSKRDVMKHMDLLVIDEVSMLRVDQLDAIDHVLRRERKSNVPFGGVQLLMIGDLYQLAPVAKKDELALFKDVYDTMFFFGSKALQEVGFITIELDHIYRQDDADFKALLNSIRGGDNSPSIMHKLNSRKVQNVPDTSDSDCIRVLTHVKQVDEINKLEYEKLDTEQKVYKANIHGDFSGMAFPTEKELSLKVGAHVMFIKNDSRNGIFNGLLGVVTKLDANSIEVKPKDRESVITVQKAVWQDVEYILNRQTKKIEEKVKGSFEQIPVKLAWAITVHKSQGLTFDKAVLDLHKCFAPGQAYVALSRCRTLDGLYLTEYVGKRAVICDESVKNFFSDDARNLPTADEIVELKKDAFIGYVKHLFDMSAIDELLTDITSDRYHRYVSSTTSPSIGDIHETFHITIVNLLESSLVPLKALVDSVADYEKSDSVNALIKCNCQYLLSSLEPLEKSVSELHISGDKWIRNGLEEKHEELLGIIKNKHGVLKDVAENGFDKQKVLKMLKNQNASSMSSSESQMAVPAPTKPKREKIPSHLQTLESFNSGMSIEEIAEERGLAQTTIQSHLVKCMELGLIDYNKFYSNEELQPIIEYVKMQEELNLKDIFEHFGGQYDYAKIRVAVFASKQNAEIPTSSASGTTLQKLQTAFDMLPVLERWQFVEHNMPELKSLLTEVAPLFDEDGEDTEEIVSILMDRGLSEADILDASIDDVMEVQETLDEISQEDYYQQNEEEY